MYRAVVSIFMKLLGFTHSAAFPAEVAQNLLKTDKFSSSQ